LLFAVEYITLAKSKKSTCALMFFFNLPTGICGFMFILARSTLASAGMKGYGIPLKFFQVEETEI
jgi:hypothetical protein